MLAVMTFERSASNTAADHFNGRQLLGSTQPTLPPNSGDISLVTRSRGTETPNWVEESERGRRVGRSTPWPIHSDYWWHKISIGATHIRSVADVPAHTLTRMPAIISINTQTIYIIVGNLSRAAAATESESARPI